MTRAHGTHEHGAAFWDEFYRDREQVWSGRPNPVLVDVVGPLDAGTALDLGAGEGGDTVWLAARGWDVTAVDVADAALVRIDARARAEGLAVTTARHDLSVDRPAGRFDLVSAQYLHSPAADWDRASVLRAAADLVAPGGLLLVVGHGRLAPWSWDPTLVMPTAAEVLDQLGLAPGEWTVEVVESREREVTGPEGEPATITDEIVAARRAS
jgi:SAM-dependent methyltransferase